MPPARIERLAIGCGRGDARPPFHGEEPILEGGALSSLCLNLGAQGVNSLLI